MFRTALLTILVLCCATVALAESKKSASAPEFQPTLVYEGIYQADRLYQYNVYQETWFASPTPKFWGKLPCPDARLTLAAKGEWVGGLTASGTCSGYEEAPRWGTGNYLNFLSGGKPVDVSR